eukprot:1141188-Pelagomonas_calceolata.AAC.6
MRATDGRCAARANCMRPADELPSLEASATPFAGCGQHHQCTQSHVWWIRGWPGEGLADTIQAYPVLPSSYSFDCKLVKKDSGLPVTSLAKCDKMRPTLMHSGVIKRNNTAMYDSFAFWCREHKASQGQEYRTSAVGTPTHSVMLLQNEAEDAAQGCAHACAAGSRMLCCFKALPKDAHMRALQDHAPCSF